MCEDLVPIFQMCEDLMTIFICENLKPIVHVTDFHTWEGLILILHIKKFGTNLSHVSDSMPVLHRYDKYVPNLHSLKI